MIERNHTSRDEILKILSGAPDIRMPLPEALTDPAFNKCMLEALQTPELIENFDRLTGCKLSRVGKGHPIEQAIDKATGFQDDQMRKFTEFVHDSVYMRLPSETLHAIRLTELTSSVEHQ